MSGKFGIAFILICALFIQLVAFNAYESNRVARPSSQNGSVLTATSASPCSVDRHFNVSAGASKPDANFGLSGTQPGIDAGFQVTVCKGVSIPNPVTPGGK